MAKTKKATETKERASVSREKRLALALRAVLDEVTDSEVLDVHRDASTLLIDLGFGEIEGIPKRLAKLNTQLTAARSRRRRNYRSDRCRDSKGARREGTGEGVEKAKSATE